MIVTLIARPGTRNATSARPGTDTVPEGGHEVAQALPGDVILTPRSPDDDLTPEQAALIERQRAAFNLMVAERAELMREQNVLRDIATEQRKHDDEYLKKLIAMI